MYCHYETMNSGTPLGISSITHLLQKGLDTNRTQSHASCLPLQLTNQNIGITLLFSRSEEVLLSSPIECQEITVEQKLNEVAQSPTFDQARDQTQDLLFGSQRSTDLTSCTNLAHSNVKLFSLRKVL